MNVQMLNSLAESIISSGPQQACGGDSIVSMILPFALIFGVFYFLVIRPQKNQQKKHEQMIESMRKGDDVVTNGGIYGKIERVLDDKLKLEVAPKVTITIKKSSVASVISGDSEPVEDKQN
ncbi:MAG: preprotein translocase subunit YajC [bacterium]